MKLDEIISLIADTFGRMEKIYGQKIFNEWAIISLFDHKARILKYSGPRPEEFGKQFLADAAGLEGELFRANSQPGDFEFARYAPGTHFDAFLALGLGLYLICNNTSETMHRLSNSPKWVEAQVPFAALSDQVRSDPLVVEW